MINTGDRVDVVLDVYTEADAYRIRVVGVYQDGQPTPPTPPGAARNIVQTFLDQTMDVRAFGLGRSGESIGNEPIHPELAQLPSAGDVEAAHQAETRLRRAEGRIAQLEAQLRAAHSDLNRAVAEAGEGPNGDGIRWVADRIRPHLQTTARPAEQRDERP
ncbi:hypothetical protein ACWD25_20630 [Streptomyces sp. NPDC002920]